MQRPLRIIGVLLATLICWPRASALSQQPTEGSKAQAAEPGKLSAVGTYRLDFSVYEIEDGKRINTRQYTMNLNDRNGDEIKIGTRVPVQFEQGKFQYLDVGTNIWSAIKERENGIDLQVRSDISSLVAPDQGSRPVQEPVLRQLSIRGSTIAPLGKPVVIGRVDDPNSKRQFELEVIVTKVK